MPVSGVVASRRKYRKNADTPYPIAPVIKAIEAALATPRTADGRWSPEIHAAVAMMSQFYTSKLYTVEERYEGRHSRSIFVGIGTGEEVERRRARIKELRQDPENAALFAAWDRLGLQPKSSS